MDFTSNITAIILVGFFSLYFILYRFFKDRIQVLNVFIAASSLLMYMLWYPPAVFILLLYAILVRYAGPVLYRNRSRALLRTLVIFLVFALAFFKYYFIVVLLVTRNPSAVANVFVPLGISFFTCTVIGYFIDLYRNDTAPPENLLQSVIFISFWPILSSGPILRGGYFFANIKEREPVTSGTVALSFVLIATGLIKKLLIADNLGSYVNWNLMFGVERMDFHEAWLTIIGFVGQIYGDFSGYSDMAIGFALLLGFRLPANFNYPYVASTIGELWRRWHISFSSWLRDYVYISLGGSRKGKMRKQINIVLTMIISGIWHGTGLNYILWGTMNGLFMAVENTLGERYTKLNVLLRRFITFFLFVTAAVFFRLDVKNGIKLLKKMFFVDSLHFRLSTATFVLPLVLLFGFVVIEHWAKFYTVDDKGYPEINKKPVVMVIMCVMLLLALIFPGKDQPFIYFKF